MSLHFRRKLGEHFLPMQSHSCSDSCSFVLFVLCFAFILVVSERFGSEAVNCAFMWLIVFIMLLSFLWYCTLVT